MPRPWRSKYSGMPGRMRPRAKVAALVVQGVQDPQALGGQTRGCRARRRTSPPYGRIPRRSPWCRRQSRTSGPGRSFTSPKSVFRKQPPRLLSQRFQSTARAMRGTCSSSAAPDMMVNTWPVSIIRTWSPKDALDLTAVIVIIAVEPGQAGAVAHLLLGADFPEDPLAHGLQPGGQRSRRGRSPPRRRYRRRGSSPAAPAAWSPARRSPAASAAPGAGGAPRSLSQRPDRLGQIPETAAVGRRKGPRSRPSPRPYPGRRSSRRPGAGLMPWSPTSKKAVTCWTSRCSRTVPVRPRLV